jgi:hypothetical protein
MPECVLRLSRDRRAAFAANELLSLERMQTLLGVPPLDPCQRGGRAEPEHLPEHRRVLEDRLLLDRQPVDARGDQPLQGLGQREFLS